ncbi:MAG: hypothetical protein U0168_28710 [Nannocystaceae bacterium]
MTPQRPGTKPAGDDAARPAARVRETAAADGPSTAAAGTATAEPAAPAKGAKATKGAKSAPAKDAKGKPSKGGRKAIDIGDDFLIEGKLEKPNAFFILRRSQADFDWARLGATFSPLVLESVQDPLF